ncbi:MAG: hypothetical protein WCP59_00030 [Actinomycetota bacterium]
MSGAFDDLAEQLDAIAAELDDRAFELLREAAAERSGRPADDKRLTQARRAVEKAAHLLRGSTSDD